VKIAIVEDDINMRKSLEIAFSDIDAYKITTFKNAKEALKKLDDTFELIITDINMPGMSGLEFIEVLDGRFEIIVITGNATLNTAIDSLRLGVKDFLTKPFEIETLIKAIKRSQKVINLSKKVTPKIDTAPTVQNELFAVVSPALQMPLKMAKKASLTDAAIILLGESGVGKEVFANFIHKHSPRATKPFIAINMAAIPENLIESELFGYEKGAFTDAQVAKKGKFEEAHGGTLFLDEIGEMPFHLQSKLLRALQEREITRLGSTKPIKIDIRLVSATNQNIEAQIKEAKFREDLYYRINTIPVNIPPLRERNEEILPIASSVLNGVCEKYGFETKSFSEEAQNALHIYTWPGNIRELISVCERSAIMSDNSEISKNDLFLEERESKKNIHDMERELICEILSEANNDLSEASVLLGMSETMLKKRLKKYSIEI
jgi:two-component system NtrC family response regulator